MEPINNHVTPASEPVNQYARSVLVTNISPSASNKTVADFFAFCGNISGLTMRSASTDSQEAIIEFSQEAATKTALLLTNALIIDRPIVVTRYTGESTTQPADLKNTRVYTESEIENKPHDLPAGQRSQTSVIASIIAAGYQLASGTLESAKAYDEKYSVTDQIYAGAASIKTSVSNLDQQYGVSSTASSWYKAASEKFAEVDQKYGVTQSTAAAFKTADNAVKSVVEHPTVVAGAEYVKGTGEALLNQPIVKDAVGQIHSVVGETQNLINEKNPAPATTTTTTTTTTDINAATPATTTSSTSTTSVNTTNPNETLIAPLGSDQVPASQPLLLNSNAPSDQTSGLGLEAPLEKKN